jgi:diguanylate cyclase (GGDEF)-like protein
MPEIDPHSEHLTVNSLVTKIVLMVFVGAFACAMLVSWAAIEPSQEVISQSIRQRYPEAARQAAGRASEWLAAGRAVLLQSTAAPWDRARESALDDLLRESDYFEGFALCSGRTETIRGVGSVPTCPPASAESLAGNPASTEPLAGNKWISTPLSNGVEVPATWVSVARKGDESVFVIGVFDREKLARLLAGYAPHSEGAMLLTSATGRVIAGGGPETTIHVAPPERPAQGDGDTLQESTDVPWRHTVNASHPIGDSGWLVVFEIPFGVAYAPLLVLIRRVLLIDLAAILTLCVAAYRVTSTILQPIELLSQGARRVAQGEFEFEIPDPGTRDEFWVLIGAFNRMLQRLRSYQDEINDSNENLRAHNVKLQQANELLEQLSITDGLTKLHNHRFFQDQLTREIRRADRASTPLSLLLVDIDDFKSLNDRFGHAAGDELLHGLALIMNATVRSTDLLARYGGEEFAVLAPGTDWEGAYQLAEKLRTAIAESSFILGSSMRITRVTVSVGVAQFKGDRKKFFDDADRALYRAKADGKNCVVADDGKDLA